MKWYMFITRLDGEIKVFAFESYGRLEAFDELDNRYTPARKKDFWVIKSYEMETKPEEF